MTSNINARFGNIIDADKPTTESKKEGVKLIISSCPDACPFTFDGMADIQDVEMVNEEILHYNMISLVKKDNQYTVYLRYGKTGRKCIKPIVSRYTSRSQAVEYVNRLMHEKKLRGYIVRNVWQNGKPIYHKARS